LQFDGWNHYIAQAALADVTAHHRRGVAAKTGGTFARARVQKNFGLVVDRAISECEDVAPKRRARTIAALCHQQHGHVFPGSAHHWVPKAPSQPKLPGNSLLAPAPSAASRQAMARPIPLLAPVTSAVFPANLPTVASAAEPMPILRRLD